MKSLMYSTALGLCVGTGAMAQSGCETVRMAEPGWTDLALTTAVASVVLEGLGYETDTKVLGVTVIYQAMVNKDLDVFLGFWDPAMATYFAPFVNSGAIETVNQNLEGAKFTFAVPKYVYEAGVKDFSDLAKHGDAFDKSFYGIEPGSNLQMTEIVGKDDFGLGDWKVVESSEQGMLAQVRRAIRSEEWIVFLGWAPHPMNVEFELEYLTGGDNYFGPDLGAASVHTQVRTGYMQECPNVGKLLNQLDFNIAFESEGMGYIIADGQTPKDAAERLIKAHPDMLDGWLDGVETLDGKPGLAAVRALLDLG